MWFSSLSYLSSPHFLLNQIFLHTTTITTLHAHKEIQFFSSYDIHGTEAITLEIGSSSNIYIFYVTFCEVQITNNEWQLKATQHKTPFVT